MFNDARAEKLFKGASPELLRKFKKFHTENPAVYTLFLKYANEAKAANRKRFSGWMIANRIRWFTTIETRGSDYKLSNDFIALYVRLLIYKQPHFEGFFQIKQMGARE